MDGMNGLELQREMAASGCDRPIQGDIPMSVQSMMSGAVDFLTKPVRSEDLLATIRLAIEKDCRAQHYVARQTQ